MKKTFGIAFDILAFGALSYLVCIAGTFVGLLKQSNVEGADFLLGTIMVAFAVSVYYITSKWSWIGVNKKRKKRVTNVSDQRSVS